MSINNASKYSTALIRDGLLNAKAVQNEKRNYILDQQAFGGTIIGLYPHFVLLRSSSGYNFTKLYKDIVFGFNQKKEVAEDEL